MMQSIFARPGLPPPEEITHVTRTPGERLFFVLAMSLSRVGDDFLRTEGWSAVLPHEKSAWEDAAKTLGIEEIK